ncbi:uncharacterized protein LOC133714701 [Rosa rugosa]|uniref:uncharacterized protein LOC133714701 n=1 Tax=Rosa rugosa TaxID=74645 RepID=UPI002B417977|nr:uncharacterized protein LOC133714701 [Rosa rugosa]
MALDDDVLSPATGGSTSSLDESANPLFLHHSDHPGLLLVSKKLTGDNYNSWCRAMRISLSAKNKTGFITGTIKEPSAIKEPEEHALWQRCNDMVLSWILNSFEPDLADSVLSCTTPHAIWEDLRERFALGNAPRIFQVQRDIYRIEQGQMSVAAYYTKLKALWDELASYNTAENCTCGAQNDRTKLMQFLMGLNESYAGTRGQILLMNPLPSVRQAYASVTQEEKQRELGSASLVPSNAATMAVLRPQAMNQGDQGSNSRNRPPVQCTYCEKYYHTEETCHKKHGYPPGHRLYKRNQRHGNRPQQRSNASANHVDCTPSFKELQATLPNLTEDQYTQVIAALNPKPSTPQANAASAAEFASGLGYEDDDWCG